MYLCLFFKFFKTKLCTLHLFKIENMRIIFLFYFFVFTTNEFYCQDIYNRKKISDVDFRYEFYVTEQKVWVENAKNYYWFKAGLIHFAEAGVGGALLNGDFSKFYHSNQIAEQGTFELGLKDGLWKRWYENGALLAVENWKNGLLNGNYFKHDNNGVLIEKGNFKRGLKNGKWILGKDTILYKNGVKLLENKVKVKSENEVDKMRPKTKQNLLGRVGTFFKDLFSKKPKKDVGKSK